MKTLHAATGAALIAVGSAAAFGFAPRHHAAAPMAVRSVKGSPAVVVELFTSEGCSSCPPADIVLADLTRKQPVGGAHVIGLEEHVTYWDGKSWRDPFSANTFTTRQSEYAQTFHNSQVYTPQMVVNGHAEFVGSDRDRALTEVRRAARAMQSPVNLTATSAADGTVAVEVQVGSLPKGVDDAEVFVALTQDGLSSHVRGGENNGRELPHNSVARSFIPLGSPGKDGGTLRTTLRLPTGAQLGECRVVAFVQKPNLEGIIGGADVSLAGLAQ